MAKIITTDFGVIHDALNKLIIEEVKAALRLVPGKQIEGRNLCRIVVSDGCDYTPMDVSVDSVWLQEVDDSEILRFEGHIPLPDWLDPNDDPEQFEGGEGDEETDETDWLDITDFHYLIEQLKDLMPESEYPHNLTNASDRIALYTAISNGRQCY